MMPFYNLVHIRHSYIAHFHHHLLTSVSKVSLLNQGIFLAYFCELAVKRLSYQYFRHRHTQTMQHYIRVGRVWKDFIYVVHITKMGCSNKICGKIIKFLFILSSWSRSISWMKRKCVVRYKEIFLGQYG